MIDHFNGHSLIPTHQSPYRDFYSTETMILDICDNILINMETSKNTAIVALDVSAALDTISYKLLIKIWEIILVYTTKYQTE